MSEPLAVGIHFLEDSYAGPPLGAAVALAAAEWGETRGEVVAGRSPLRLMRLWSRGRPDPAEAAAKARAWSDRGWRVQALNEVGQQAFQAFLAAVGADPGDPYRYGWPVRP